MSKGKEKQTHEFLRGSAILTYVHASKRSKLEDFTIQAFQGFKCLRLTLRCQWTFTIKRLSPNLFTQVSHTLKLLQLRWWNESYNKTHSKSRYSKMKNKNWFNICISQVWRLKISRVLFIFACWRSFKMSWIWVLIVWAQKLAVTHILGVSGLPFMESGKPDLCYR